MYSKRILTLTRLISFIILKYSSQSKEIVVFSIVNIIRKVLADFAACD